MAVIYSLLKRNPMDIIEEFYNKYYRIYYTYNKAQSKSKDQGFDTLDPVDFTVHYHTSVATYKKEKRGKHGDTPSSLFLDVKATAELEPIMKLVCAYALKEGYSPMPDKVLMKNLETRFFVMKGKSKIAFKDKDQVIVARNGRVLLSEYREVKEDTLIFPSKVTVGSRQGGSRAKFDIGQIDINAAKATWEISVVKDQKTFINTVLRINSYVFDLSTIAPKPNYSPTGILSDIDFIVSRGISNKQSNPLAVDKETFDDTIRKDGLNWLDMDINLSILLGHCVNRTYDLEKTMTWEDIKAEHAKVKEWGDEESEESEETPNIEDTILLEDAVDEEIEEVASSNSDPDETGGVSEGEEVEDEFMSAMVSDFLSSLKTNENFSVSAMDKLADFSEETPDADFFNKLQISSSETKQDRDWLKKNAGISSLCESYENFAEGVARHVLSRELEGIQSFPMERCVREAVYYTIAEKCYKNLRTELGKGHYWTELTAEGGHASQIFQDYAEMKEVNMELYAKAKRRKTVLLQSAVLLHCNKRMNISSSSEDIVKNDEWFISLATAIRVTRYYGEISAFVNRLKEVLTSLSRKLGYKFVVASEDDTLMEEAEESFRM